MQRRHLLITTTIGLFLAALAAVSGLHAGGARAQRAASSAAASATPEDWVCAHEMPVLVNVGWLNQAQAQAQCAQRAQYLAQHPPTPLPAMPTPCPPYPPPPKGVRLTPTACEEAYTQAINRAIGVPTDIPGVTVVGARDYGVVGGGSPCAMGMLKTQAARYEYTNSWRGIDDSVCAGALVSAPQQGVLILSYFGPNGPSAPTSTYTEYRTQAQDGALTIVSGNGDSASHHLVTVAGEPPPTPPASISPTGADVLQLVAADGVTYSFDVAKRQLTRTGSAPATPAAGH